MLINAFFQADIATPGGGVLTIHLRSLEPEVAEQEAVGRCRDRLARNAARLERAQVLAEADADLHDAMTRRRMTAFRDEKEAAVAGVLRDVQGGAQRAQVRLEIFGVVALVGSRTTRWRAPCRPRPTCR
ncbi:hypothetical protein D3869_32005 (plasmid) [Azospirillum brasilense]|uniref:Uncharacterized protein n=1 Tax=Azospirillum brasilense TaxID=192 RepID=A0A4D8RRI6_AZOBR|nr:hypothetical protein [Azospirillum brasilense]QCO19312.1 hypothetical protein D3869_29065 [Azospirillum brasilense]QCO19833.1 hypothetical protein D3869_32005 [Azospirillum brasilense]